MKIVYYSSLIFTDCDFPLIREFQRQNQNIQYYIEVVTDRCCLGLFDLSRYSTKRGVICAKEIEEFKIYEDYLELQNTFLVFRSPKLLEYKNWITYLKLCKQIARFNPNVVHFTNSLGVSESFLYWFRNKMLLTVHDPFLHTGHENFLNEYKRKLAFRIVPKLVLLNEQQADDFSLKFNVPKDKLYFNKLGVYTCLPYLASSQRKSMISECDYVLFYGFISPYKGIDILCKAMELVHEKCPKAICVIAGKGKLYFDFTKYVDKKYIILVNRFIYVDELVSLIDKSRFIVCPYKDATQSGVISSSFAFAKPVLATNVGGLGESVIDGITGRLVSPNSPEALAKAIIDMYDNQDVLKCYSENIKTTFWNGDRKWSSIAQKYEMIYEK